ncbi:MAG: hypothetical protein ACRD40_11975 [Candidatus Acidiferrales bacterium]
MKKFAIIAATTVAVLAMIAPHAAAQGCAMCYQNAAASGAKGQAALRHGILILLIPALTLFGGIIAAIYRRDNLPQ